MKKVVLKVIVSCAILGAVGYVASRIVKSRKDTKNWRERIALDLYVVRRLLEGPESQADMKD